MKTLIAAATLIVFGAVAKFLAVWIINLAGLPGALVALKKPGRVRAVAAVVVGAIGQSYVYLAYTAFVVNWTRQVGRRPDAPLAFLLWLPAFLAVVLPILLTVAKARVEANERGFMNVQDQALHFTTYAAALGFLLFAFVPGLITLGWGWIPFL